MDRHYILIGISALILILLFSSGFFRTTGYAVADQKLLVSLDIPPDQRTISPGESLLLEVALRVPGGNIDQTSIVDMDYSIKDLKGNIISSKKESGAIAVKESTVTSLLVPTNTRSGVYTAYVDVTYEDQVYQGSKTFEVVGKFGGLMKHLDIVIYVLVGLIILVVLIIVIRKIRDRPETPKIQA